MKEKPILFSTPMVQAILDGRKTQTRRIVKGEALSWLVDSEFTPEFVADPDNNMCPYGKVGDRLWVRETIVAHPEYSGKDYKAGLCGPLKDDNGENVAFRGYLTDYPDFDEIKKQMHFFKKIPAIHMPKNCCRIFLEIESVRVERLNEITRGDAMAEGCPFPNMAKGDNPVDWFRSLWQSINGADSWEKNPFVWRIEFKRIIK
jgi:hypothetical protein